jgi:flagellar protein FlaF
MYQNRYNEIQAEDPKIARGEELQLIEHSVALLERAQAAGANSREAIEAIYFANRLWSYFLEDLTNPNNALADAVKAGLISVGVHLLKQCEEIRAGRSANFGSMADISRTVAEGLR